MANFVKFIRRQLNLFFQSKNKSCHYCGLFLICFIFTVYFLYCYQQPVDIDLEILENDWKLDIEEKILKFKIEGISKNCCIFIFI